MKRFRIKYVLGSDIKITTIEANDIVEAQRIFYMSYEYSDIIDIGEE